MWNAVNAAQTIRSRPAFINEPIYTNGLSRVEKIVELNDKDLVVLKNGFDQGFRIGMVCKIFNQNNYVGEIILVAVELESSVGLILELSNNKIIKDNDLAKIKVSLSV